MKSLFLIVSAIVCWLFLTSISLAVEETQNLPEVVVTATKAEKKTLEVPASITVITAEEIKKTKAKSINDLIESIPGVLAQNRNYSDDMRIVIRGVGNRATFGIRGILVVLDGVPVSDIDAHKNDLVDMNSVERVEVLRGPYSTIYGSQAMGGVINIITKRGKLAKEEKGVRISNGSYATQQYNVFNMGKLNDTSSYYVFVGRQSTEGYRQHNKWGATRFFTKEDFGLDNTSNLQVMYSYSNSLLELPGDLTLAQFNADPQQANPTNFNKNYQRNQIKSRASVLYEKEFAENNNLMANIFYQDLILDHPIFQYVDNYTTGIGGDIRWSVGTNWFGKPQTVITGLNIQGNSADLRRWQNNSSPTATVKGPLLALNTLNTDKLGVYLQDEILLSDPLRLTLGVRYDNIGYNITNQLNGKQGSYSGNKVSPKVALNYMLSPTSSLFANYSTGFSAPSYFEVFSNPASMTANPVLPEEAVSYEIGYKGAIGTLQTQISLYSMSITNEIYSKVVGGTTIYYNIGQGNHNGIELALSHPLGEAWTVDLNYALGTHTYGDYLGLNGNHLPGVPDSVLNGNLKYAPKGTGFNATLGFYNLGPYYVNDANTLTYAGYTTYQARLGYKPSSNLEFWLIGDNIFNTKYANIAYMNGAIPMYIPGNGAGYTLGINYQF